MVVRDLGIGIEALNSVLTIIYSFLLNPGFELAWLYAVSLSRDTDTASAMTGAIASAYYGYGSIPKGGKPSLQAESISKSWRRDYGR